MRTSLFGSVLYFVTLTSTIQKSDLKTGWKWMSLFKKGSRAHPVAIHVGDYNTANEQTVSRRGTRSFIILRGNVTQKILRDTGQIKFDFTSELLRRDWRSSPRSSSSSSHSSDGGKKRQK